MKITRFILAVTALLFAWLSASYFRPVPSSTYEHSDQNNLAGVEHTEEKLIVASE